MPSPWTELAPPGLSTALTVPPPKFLSATIRVMGWSLGLTLAAADAWATRFSMNPDGVSYLDMGDAIWRGDLHAAINGHWSPLYPCVAGLVLKVLRPSMYWEFPVVHLLNLVIFVWALIGFEFLLKNFIARRKNAKPSPNSSATGLPEWAWWLLGYSVFLPASLTHITMRRATPDLLLSGFIYLAAGLLLRIRSAPHLCSRLDRSLANDGKSTPSPSLLLAPIRHRR